MKKILAFFFVISLLCGSPSIYAASCFPPSGPIKVTGLHGEYLQGTINPYGINIYHPEYGNMEGSVDSFGYFKVYSDGGSLSGTIDVSCHNNKTISNDAPLLCAPPSISGCTQESDYQSLQIFYNRAGIANDAKLTLCRNQIDANKAATATFNSCISSTMSAKPVATYDPELECFKKGLSFSYNKKTKSCIKNPEYSLDKNQSCIKNYSINSEYDTNSGKCTCQKGYDLEYDSSSKKITCEKFDQDSYLKALISTNQKLYPDANLTGSEKTADEVKTKVSKSASRLAYKKIKPLTTDQIIENINRFSSLQDAQNYVDNLKLYQKVPKLVSKKSPAYSSAVFAKKIKIRDPLFASSYTSDTLMIKDFLVKYPAFKDRVK